MKTARIIFFLCIYLVFPWGEPMAQTMELNGLDTNSIQQLPKLTINLDGSAELLPPEVVQASDGDYDSFVKIVGVQDSNHIARAARRHLQPSESTQIEALQTTLKASVSRTTAP